MNKLECQVSTCRHWSDNCCCLPGIQVDGPAARESSQTCCESYEEQNGSGHETQNVFGGNGPSEQSSICCSAEHCVYNENSKCHADCVCVGCTCQDPTSKSGTECCTFRPE